MLVFIIQVVEPNTSGANAQYIPQLAEVDPDQVSRTVTARTVHLPVYTWWAGVGIRVSIECREKAGATTRSIMHADILLILSSCDFLVSCFDLMTSRDDACAVCHLGDDCGRSALFSRRFQHSVLHSVLLQTDHVLDCSN